MDDLSKKPQWQRQRELLLEGICRELKRNFERGAKRKAALSALCTRYTGTLLENGKGRAKPLKLSVPTLRRLYERWVAAGETRIAFELDYRPGRQKTSHELLSEFHRQASMPGVRKMSVAYDAIKRDWDNGKTVPGLGTWQEWWMLNRRGEPLPHQAPEFPVCEATFYRHQPKKAVKALGNLGVAAMKRESMHIDRTIANLRPCELFVLDDKRPDLLVIDDETGKVTDVCIYLCWEMCAKRIVGFSCRPAVAMNSSDVDALIARVLEAEGYGSDYVTHILLERGTVAMSPAGQALIEAVTDGKVKILRTGMDGGKRAPGFEADKASGHWQGKPIESLMAKIDLMLMHLPGQRGNKHENMPANLAYRFSRKLNMDGKTLQREIKGGEAAVAESLAQVEVACGHKLGLDTGLLWLTEFNMVLRQLINRHNASRDHNYEGIGTITQREITAGVWEDVPCRS